MSAVTDWIAAVTKPTLEGVYQILPRGSGGSPFWSYWDGEKWSFFTTYQKDVHERRKLHKSVSHPPNMPWRGLAEAPKRSAK